MITELVWTGKNYYEMACFCERAFWFSGNLLITTSEGVVDVNKGDSVVRVKDGKYIVKKQEKA